MKDGRMAAVMAWLKGAMLRHVRGMITCREFEEFVQAYIDGELPKNQLSVFRMHLRVCRECRDYLVAYQRAMEVGKAVLGAADDPVPGAVPEDLVKAVLNSRKV